MAFPKMLQKSNGLNYGPPLNNGNFERNFAVSARTFGKETRKRTIASFKNFMLIVWMLIGF